MLTFTATYGIAKDADFTVDGFSYAITSLTVEVANGPNEAVVTVPSTVEYSNITYRVTGIGSEAFCNHKKLTSVDMPSITYISNGFARYSNSEGTTWYGAFYGCKKLSQANMPAATSIGDLAFESCDALTSVSLPVATSIGVRAFSGCDALTSVSLPAATLIGGIAFDDCKALTSVSLPAATSIGDWAFKSCKALTSVSLPVATSIGADAFGSCDALTSVSLPVATSILDRAFESCKALRSGSLPFAKSIGYEAFRGCKALTSVSMPVATSIGERAFLYCDALTSVSLPAATSIGADAFGVCDALTSVSLPAATSIGESAFSGCQSLSDIYVGSDPADCYGSTFDKVTYVTATLHVPAGCASKYKAADYWKQFNFISEDYDPTGIKNTNAENVKVLCENGNVNITGLKNGMKVEFYSVNGQLLGASVANAGAVSFKTSEHIVICKMAGTSIKVLVK